MCVMYSAGFNVETVPFSKHDLVMWDVGGRNAVSWYLTHRSDYSEGHSLGGGHVTVM